MHSCVRQTNSYKITQEHLKPYRTGPFNLTTIFRSSSSYPQHSFPSFSIIPFSPILIIFPIFLYALVSHYSLIFPLISISPIFPIFPDIPMLLIFLTFFIFLISHILPILTKFLSSPFIPNLYKFKVCPHFPYIR